MIDRRKDQYCILKMYFHYHQNLKYSMRLLNNSCSESASVGICDIVAAATVVVDVTGLVDIISTTVPIRDRRAKHFVTVGICTYII